MRQQVLSEHEAAMLLRRVLVLYIGSTVACHSFANVRNVTRDRVGLVPDAAATCAAAAASSSATVGTRTMRQTRRSPWIYRASKLSKPPRSRRSVLARRARRLTSMLDESTTWFVIPCTTR